MWLSACLPALEPDVGPLRVADEDGASAPTGDGSDSDDASTRSDGGAADRDAAQDGSGPGSADEDGGDSDAGGPPQAGCKVKDSDPSTDVSFSKHVWPILTGCRCHNPESDDPFAILESGLTIESYASLRTGGDNTGADIIVAGNACDSIILQKLSETPPFGDRMPRDGPYLSLELRTLISDWIVEGARDN